MFWRNRKAKMTCSFHFDSTEFTNDSGLIVSPLVLEQLLRNINVALIYYFLKFIWNCYLQRYFISQNETPPFRENWKAPFSHLSVTIQSTEWQVHSVTIQCHSVTIPSPFSNIHFSFFVYIWSYMHYFFIYLMLDPPE